MSIKFCCDFCDKPLPEIGLYDEIPCIKFLQNKRAEYHKDISEFMRELRY